MTRQIAYTRFDRAPAGSLLTALVDLYAEVYAEPPYQEGPDQVERFRSSLPEEADRPGFELITAEAGGHLIGAAYGWTMLAGNWWSRADQQPSADVRDTEKFAVMEWIVRPDRRGEGIGAELIRLLLADRPERYATLASDPRSAARKMYERAGWRQAARTTLTWGPTMDLLVLDLPMGRRPGSDADS